MNYGLDCTKRQFSGAYGALALVALLPMVLPLLLVVSVPFQISCATEFELSDLKPISENPSLQQGIVNNEPPPTDAQGYQTSQSIGEVEPRLKRNDANAWHWDAEREARSRGKKGEPIRSKRIASNIDDLAKSTTLKFGGYVKLDSIFDFDDAGNRLVFDPNTIPITGGQGGQYSFTARQTRLNVESVTKTQCGDLRLFVEGDFASLGRDELRLRHAYGEIGSFLAGQTWTLATDSEAFPETLDFGGPDGNAQVRRPQVRWSPPISNSLTWASSIHQSESFIDTVVPGEFRNRIPIFSSSLRYRDERGHVYLVGGVGASRFVPDVGSIQEATIWGFVYSTMRRIGGDKIIAQFGASNGFTEFLPSFIGDGGEIVTIAPGALEPLSAYGGVIAFQRVWCTRLRSNVAYRAAVVDNFVGQGPEAIHRNQYFAVNAIWSPLGNRRIDIGLEYLWGFRENVDRASEDAHRLMFSAIFRLP